MDQFSYVTLLVSFVVAFGVSSLLAGWARQYVQRAQTKIYPLQIAASALLLVALVQSTWTFWFYRGVAYTFVTFFLALMIALTQVGAAALILPPRGGTENMRDYYFGVRRAVYGLLGAWIVLGGVQEIVTIGVVSPIAPVGVLVAFRGGAVGLCRDGLVEPSRRHWGALAVLALLQIGWIATVSSNPGAV